MCFSADAGLAAGVIVGAVGVDALRHVHSRREVPLAALPLLFAAHQLTETFVWWGEGGQVTPSTGRVAVWLYLAFTFWVLPVLMPLGVMAVEPDERRRRVMAFCAVVGSVVVATYLAAMVAGPVTAEIDGRHIAYSVPVAHEPLVNAAYVFAGCLPLLVSSHRYVVVFGVANAAAVAALLWLTTTGGISLWCVWAAVASAAIALHLRRTQEGTPSEDRRRSSAVPAGAG